MILVKVLLGIATLLTVIYAFFIRRCPKCGDEHLSEPQEVIRGMPEITMQRCKTCDLTQPPEAFQPGNATHRHQGAYNNGVVGLIRILVLGTLGLIFLTSLIAYLMLSI